MPIWSLPAGHKLALGMRHRDFSLQHTADVLYMETRSCLLELMPAHAE